MLVLMRKQVETELKLEKKFRELCEEVSNVVKEREDVVEELERLSGNHVAKKIACLLKHGQKRDLNKMTRLQIMMDESHLGVREKHTFVSNKNLGTLELAITASSRGLFNGMLVYFDREYINDLEFANGLHNLWVELLERTNKRQILLTTELNAFGGSLAVQCAEFLKQFSQNKVLKMLELRKMIAEVHRQVHRKIDFLTVLRFY
ncbi:hypothetical protein Tco_0783549 [Tanacetum coccineum]